MCQFTNLLHWMVLHTPLEIVEHHHHDGVDLFPDFGRQIPFGTGTSILYNYLDYRFYNPTPHTVQVRIWVTQTHLCGELRSDAPRAFAYHIHAVDECFVQEADGVYRCNTIVRRQVDKTTGCTVKEEILKKNHARVLYDTTALPVQNREEPQ
jgi:vancomycin resistance protein VanW